MKRIKPKRLQRGDTVAIVSLSSGILGEPCFIHKYNIAKKRLEEDFGLHVIAMPHALKGAQFVYEHPELRAKDWMDAVKDDTIQAIFCAIGGDDTIRMLPYVEFDTLRENPKIFLGYSDTTANHFMMLKAGVISYYGPSVMCEFGEYVHMFDYTKEAVQKLLFEDSKGYCIPSSPFWTKEIIPWAEENQTKARKLEKELHGYEVLQGRGTVAGPLLGGCLEAFMMYTGTSIWPTIEEWSGCLLCLETAEDTPSPDMVTWLLRNLAAQGIFKVIQGIIFAKPMGEAYYEEYKQVLHKVIAVEEEKPELPILYNVNFGHGTPNGILPLGVLAELDCEHKTVTLLESAVG